MLEFTFTDSDGNVYTSRKEPSEQCDGGCCFNQAVAEFRQNVIPTYVPGQAGITITIKGV
jgi:hypothetical protein